MGRPRGITEDEILAAARAVFLKKGIAATTAEVAARCGVGEATVFRRFPTKAELFRAAMRKEELPAWVQSLPERAGRGDPEKTLMELGAEVIAYGRKIFPLWMMLMANPTVGAPSAAEMEGRTSWLLAIMKALTEFFAAEIDAGRVQVRDPQVVVYLFFGAVRHFVLLEMFTKGRAEMPEEEVFLAEMARVLCRSG